MTIMNNQLNLKRSLINTKLGPMVALANESALYLLEFANNQVLDKKINKLGNAIITNGVTKPIAMIETELELYFLGKLTRFTTPIHVIGTPFQKKAWSYLLKIPYGHTRSYLEQAQAIGNDKAYRAIANANGANIFAVIIPCHRIISSNGNLGGYSGGIDKKLWLLNHESHQLAAN